MYAPETSCRKESSIHIKNMRIKQLCNRKVWDFAMALRARNVSGAFQKRAQGCSKFQDQKLTEVSNFLVWKFLSPLMFRVVWDCSSSKLTGRQYKQRTLNEKNTNTGLPYSGFNWSTRRRWATQCPQSQSSEIRKKLTLCIRFSELRGTDCLSANVLHIRSTALCC